MQFEKKNAEARLDKYQKLKLQPKQTTLGAFVKTVKKVNDWLPHQLHLYTKKTYSGLKNNIYM